MLVRETVVSGVYVLAGQSPWNVTYDDLSNTRTVEQLFYFFGLTQTVDDLEVPFSTVIEYHITSTVFMTDLVLSGFKANP
ncbi:hypothetical protein D3C84_1166860 [compost metagenome]